MHLGGVGSPHPSGRTVSITTTVPRMNEVGVAMVGGGNMGAALLGGMIASGEFDPDSLAVVERLEERRAELARMFPAVTVVAETPPCAAAVIAVKPDGAADAVAAAVSAGARRILSIAAGVTLDAVSYTHLRAHET